MIRESNEELSLVVKALDLSNLGISIRSDDAKTVRHLFLYKTDQESFEDLEGKGAHWLSFDEARERLDIAERFDDLIDRINNHKTT